MSFDQQGDTPPRQRVHTLYILAEDQALARTRLQITAQDVDRRGLACTVFTQQPQDPAPRNAETQVLVDHPATVIVRQVAALNDIFFHVRLCDLY